MARRKKRKNSHRPRKRGRKKKNHPSIETAKDRAPSQSWQDSTEQMKKTVYRMAADQVVQSIKDDPIMSSLFNQALVENDVLPGEVGKSVDGLRSVHFVDVSDLRIKYGTRQYVANYLKKTTSKRLKESYPVWWYQRLLSKVGFSEWQKLLSDLYKSNLDEEFRWTVKAKRID